MSQRICSMACSKCREVKPLDEFHRSKGRPQGRHPQCKDCRSELGKAERLARGTKQAARARLLDLGLQRCSVCDEVKQLGEFYKYARSASGRKGQCADCYTRIGAEYRSTPEARRVLKERRVKFIEQNPEEAYMRQRKYGFKKKYGITLEDYEDMLSEQEGRCAICFQLPLPGRPLYVDHDHETEAVRGLLCQKCNSGIGLLGDDVNRLASASRYLLSAGSRSATTWAATWTEPIT